MKSKIKIKRENKIKSTINDLDNREYTFNDLDSVSKISLIVWCYFW